MCDKSPKFTDVSIKLGYELGDNVYLVKVIRDAILNIERCGHKVDYTDCLDFIARKVDVRTRIGERNDG